MSDIVLEKKELRKRMLNRRMTMTEPNYHEKNKQLYKKVMELEVLPTVSLVHCYVAMSNRREPETEAIIRDLMKMGKRVAVPLMNLSSRELNHIIIDEDTSWTVNKWGIKEPSLGLVAIPSEIELVLIPMLAGDKKRNRLGYGKGYYDTFLAKTDAFKAGLLFSDMLCDAIPTEPHDIPLDAIVTESGFI